MKNIDGRIQNGFKVRAVDEYLRLLKAAGRSTITLRNYRQILTQYSRFIGVPLEDLHNHLNVEDFVRYAESIADRRDTGRKSTLLTISRYLKLNGVVFDELEVNVFKVKIDDEPETKPLTKELLQKMMDLGNPHSRAIISFLISTGCRAGETSQILLSDVGRIERGSFVSDINGDVVKVRNEIAKRKKGGLVFLTAEAHEYLTLWLRDRDRYITDANERTSKLLTAGTRHERVPRKDTGKRIFRPESDNRLFACSYVTIDKVFGRLYRYVDGERASFNRAKITAHTCRAFFRTEGAKGFGIDLTEGILRHAGYLNAAYVRMTPEDRRAQFQAGEAVLYITRADHRIQGNKLDELKRENSALLERLQQVEQRQQMIQTIDTEEFTPEDIQKAISVLKAMQKANA